MIDVLRKHRALAVLCALLLAGMVALAATVWAGSTEKALAPSPAGQQGAESTASFAAASAEASVGPAQDASTGEAVTRQAGDQKFDTLDEAVEAGAVAPVPPNASAYDAGNILVTLNGPQAQSPQGLEAIETAIDAISAYGGGTTAELLSESGDDGIVLVALPDDVSVEEALLALANDGIAAFAQPNYFYTPSMAVSDPYADWELNAVNAYKAWDHQITDHSVTIAVMDTGVRLTHEDLKDNIWQDFAWDTVSNQPLAQAGIANGGDDNRGTLGHGTGVASVAAAEANNDFGMAGSSYNAMILPVRIDFSTVGIMKGCRYILDHKDDLNIRVVNMSFGGYMPMDDAAWKAAYPNLDEYKSIASLDHAGILVVAAAGNNGTTADDIDQETGENYPQIPSDFPEVVGVTAVNNGNAVASFSDHNSYKDIAAPGGNVAIATAVSDTSISRDNGTSFASPMVAGVAALLFAVDGSLTPEEAKAILCETATDLGTQDYDTYYGYGLLNAEAAVEKAQEVAADPAPVILTGSLPDAVVGDPYSQSLQARGATPITWEIVDGSLPDGLSLASDGAITGTPTATGSFTFTVRASNEKGEATKSLTITTVASQEEKDFTYTVSYDGKVSITGYNGTAKDVAIPGKIEGDDVVSVSLVGYNLTGLDVSDCTALTQLICSGNQLTALVTSKNTALETLYCDNNGITALNVSSNVALRTLYCFNNRLTSLDVSKNTALTQLNCDNNLLTGSLDTSNNLYLEGLSCGNNQLTALDMSENTELTYLSCNNNRLTSLGVSGNAALTSISCYGNQLTSLTVGNNPALKTLYCFNNQLTSLDVSKNTALEALICASNRLTSLNIDANGSLVYLSCDENQLTTLNVSGCTTLEALYCYDNPQLTTLDVSGCTALETLECYDNPQLATLNASNCVSLETLDCYGSQSAPLKLTTLDVSGCTALKVLNCYDTQLKSLKANGCTALEELNCYDNPQLASLDVSGCTALRTLDCYDTQLATLDVSGCTALTQLWCSNGQLTTLNVSGCTALEDLDCYGNQLTSLDVDDCTALTSLRCTDNQLKSLDVSGCTFLTQLNCFDNQLTSLTVGNNPLLETLYCFNNLLTSLDVSSCTALADLDCSINQLTGLVVSSNTALTDLNCYGNQLTTLYVESNPVLANLNCASNQLTSLDTSSSAALRQLLCADNQLESLDVGSNLALTQLNCENNKITFLKVDSNPLLEALYCANNQLDTLDVSKNTALVALSCGSNRLGSLKVDNNPALTYLICPDNQLTALDVGNNAFLVFLNCGDNQLTSLVTSNNTDLWQLICPDNQLTSLDLSKNTALTYLICPYNQLKSLDVSSNTALEGLECNNNYIVDTAALEAWLAQDDHSGQVLPQDALSSEKDITSFAIGGVEGAISDDAVTVEVPYGTDVTDLTPEVAITGVSYAPVGPQDFSNGPVTYTVTAADGTTKEYRVTVTVAAPPASSEKDITSFAIGGVEGTISGTTITVNLPYGTGVTDLTPEVAITGVSYAPAGAQDFSNGPVTYTVTAADSTTKEYRVTVTVAAPPASSEKDITSFAIGGVEGTISGTTITVNLPYGTGVTDLTPTVVHTGASVSPTGPQDFSNGPVTYTVTAADSSTKEYRVTVTVAAPPTSAPGAPQDLSATSSGVRQVTLAWAPPADNGGSPITNYEASKDGGTTWVAIDPADPTAASYVFTELDFDSQTGVDYTFAVRAVNAVGAGEAATVTGRSVVEPSTAEVAWIAGDGQITAIAFTFEEGTGGSPILSYSVTATPVGGGTPVTVTGPSSPLTITGLENGVEYRVTGTLTNAVGTGSIIPFTATPYATPDAPENLSAVSGDGEVALSWVAPGFDGGNAITRYEVSMDEGSTWIDAGDTFSYTFTGLSRGTGYTLSVRAVNAAGGGAVATTTATPLDVPGAPQNVTATAGNAQARVSFTPPASDGGSPITGYTVTATPVGGGAPVSVTGTSSPVTVTGLENGVEYAFTVAATNAIGTGAASASVSATPSLPASSDKDITSFVIDGVSGTISDDAITLTVPAGTDVTALTPVIGTTGASVSPTGPQDFSSPVTYTVTAADGTTKTYTVTVTVAAPPASSDKDITSFTLAGVAGTISGTSIAVTVPYGTDVTALTPVIVHTGTSISPAGPQDFTGPVTYTVTAADGTTKTYTVTVTVAAPPLSSEKDITSFMLAGVAGTISGTTITVNLPYGTDVTALTPVIVHTGASISPIRAQNFTSPVTYTVTAEDDTTKAYTVTVTVAAPPRSSEKDITSFTILGVVGTISGTTITVNLPYGTDVTALTPTVVHTGASISPTGSQDFTSPVTYTVTAEDGTTKAYTVTVTVAAPPRSSDKDILLFSLAGVPGTITGTTIALTVPAGTDVTALTPTIAINGVSYSPAGPQDFTGPVTYTVTAEDGTTKAYTVTVTVAAPPRSSDKDITSFTLAGVPGTITGTAIALTVPAGTDVTALTPTIAINGASVSPAGPQDFTSPVTYTVTAADGTTKAYTVTVTVAAAPKSSDKDITSFVVDGVPGVISGTTITVNLPNGTDVTSLTPVIGTTGASVSPAGPQDFTSPVTYTVTAADGTTKAYTVTVTVAALPSFTVLDDFPVYTGSEVIWARVDAPAATFQGLMLGTKVIDPSDYAITEGSTVITFKDAYLKTLANGTYSVRALFDNGYADLTLTVAVPQTASGGDVGTGTAAGTGSEAGSGSSATPPTGDGSGNMAGLSAVLLASGLCVLAVLARRRRQLAKAGGASR